ncbi:class I SAM-dependent methyltransferase [Pseudomonas nitroreducens]|uniref:class I SAM-dependent methyltransferase n=1 Tax=Pseudomonas nitroreducens TaxID=46680 RepID=UPI0028A9E895|nr:class I SAM-dependent methyltransferase [Pseudomonas nitroreducens]
MNTITNNILDLDTPNYLSGKSAWIEHIPFALSLIRILRPRALVELGTHYGDSYFAFCQSIKEHEIECKAFAVDTWVGDEHAGHYDDRVYRQVQSTNEEHYNYFSRLIRSTFDEAAEAFPEGSVDLLHIDGLHSYEAVLHDFETWKPRLSERAVVLFHDTNVRERGFGVWKLWAEISDQYPSFEFEHGHGLGVLAIGSKHDQATLELFDWLRRSPLQARKFYSFLGGRLSQLTNLQIHAGNLSFICEDRLQNIHDLQAKETEQALRIESLEAKVLEHEATLLEQQQLALQKDELVRQKSEQIQQLEEEKSEGLRRYLLLNEQMSEIQNSNLWKATHFLRKYGR